MSVNIIWSTAEGGSALVAPVDHGNVANGSNSSGEVLYLRHDGAAAITAAALYLRQYSGTYTGSFSASADLAELLAWANADTTASFGGFQCHFESPYTTWPTYSDKSPGNAVAFRSGVGDSEANAVTIPVVAGASSAGVIDPATSVHFSTRVVVPTDEDTIGTRQWDSVLRFNYTS